MRWRRSISRRFRDRKNAYVFIHPPAFFTLGNWEREREGGWETGGVFHSRCPAHIHSLAGNRPRSEVNGDWATLREYKCCCAKKNKMPVAFDAAAAADNGHELWSSPAPTKGTGFVHRVFTMYHATSVAAAKEILRCGELRLSNGSGNMLGAGVYATHTYEVRRDTACQTFIIENFENVTVSQIPIKNCQQ